MGRRKKEQPGAHREAIASAASALFQEKGIRAVSMDEIAKAAGYSKATLYVYFENKEEIVSVLVLESMKKLSRYISAALDQQAAARERYGLICRGLTEYQEEFPFYFKIALDKINIDFKSSEGFRRNGKPTRQGKKSTKSSLNFFAPASKRGSCAPT